MNKESPILITRKFRFKSGLFQGNLAGSVNKIQLFRWYVEHGYPYYELSHDILRDILDDIDYEVNSGRT